MSTYLKQELQEVERYFELEDKVNPAVSVSGVYWHLHHILQAGGGMLYNLRKSNPAEYKPAFNANRLFVFTFKRLPRGKAKAPKNLKVPEVITKEILQDQLAKTKDAIARLNEVPKNGFVNHFVFGHLNLKRTKTLVKIHTQHHLRIIRDILK